MTGEFLLPQNTLETLAAQFHFDLGPDWRAPEASKRIYGQFINGSLLLCRELARLDIKEGDWSVQGTPAAIIGEAIDLYGGMDLERADADFRAGLIYSHTFIPYVFSHLLRVLDDAGLLSEAGLTAFGLADGFCQRGIETFLRKQLESITPAGCFLDSGKSGRFLRFLAMISRDSFSKTPGTEFRARSLATEKDFLKRIFLSDDPDLQSRVLGDFRERFNPATKPVMTTADAKNEWEDLTKFSRLLDSEITGPGDFIRLSQERREFSAIIFEALSDGEEQAS